jgi:hypothetical protein
LNAIAPLKKRKADGRMLRGHLEAFYFCIAFFLRGLRGGGAGGVGTTASAQALVICRAFFAVSLFTDAVACARADPAILFAALRNMLINGFFITAALSVKHGYAI